MGIFNFFGDSGENRVFNYHPVYYDPEKDRSRVRSKEGQTDGDKADGTYVPGSYIKGAFRDGHYKRSHGHLTKLQSIIGIITMILIFAVLYFIAKYYSMISL